MREVDLAKPVANWLRANGYPLVYAEVWRGPVDLVGWNESANRIACVELKPSLTRKVLHQACLHQIATTESYVAVGTSPRASSVAIARQNGMGVLSVQGETVTIVATPELCCDVFQEERDDLIDCLRHSTPSDKGGLPCLAGTGPAQEVARRVRAYLLSQPDARWKNIYANVLNHYDNHHSLAQVMNRRFGILLRPSPPNSSRRA